MSDFEDVQTLRTYLITLMTETKKINYEISSIKDEISVWEGRVALASEKGRSDLQAQASVKLDEIRQKLETRSGEKNSLDAEIATLKRKLLVMKNKPEMSVDADMLLSQFQMMLGESDELEQKFKSEEADAMLSELKNKMTDDQ